LRTYNVTLTVARDDGLVIDAFLTRQGGVHLNGESRKLIN